MKKLIIILSFLMPAFLFGQSESVVLEWDTDHNPVHFTHALYADGENTLPYYSRKIAWEANETLPVVRIKVNASSEIDAASLAGKPVHHVKSEPLLSYSLAWEARKSFVIISLLPFVRNESGNIERVDGFEIVLEQKAALARLKSQKAGSWSEHSVLASGQWYKVSVEQSGMHKLSYEQLLEIGIQNPASVRVYGTGARLLPERFSEGYVDDLSPVPVYLENGGDGIFGPGDHILFYAEGVVSWEFSQEEQRFQHKLHDHAYKGYYFLTDSKGPPVLPQDVSLSGDTPTHTAADYDFRTHFEEERYNLIKSGKEWYGDIFGVNLENSYPFRIPARTAGESFKISVTTAARSGLTTSFRVKANNQYLGSISMSGTDLSHYTSTYAYESVKTFETTPQSDIVTVTLEYERPDSDSEGWLNHLVLNGRCKLAMTGVDELSFRDSRSAGSGNVTSFRLGDGSQTVIWDITDPASPLNVPYTTSGPEAQFTLVTDEIREFIAFHSQGASFPSPGFKGEGEGLIENQNLHGLKHPDMIILTPKLFREQAQKLADHRKSHDGLDVEIVIQEQVFNEFSSGTPDVTAIRNAMKMFYDRSGGAEDYCRYLLLFGDGSYDNRSHPDRKDNPNLILTYQSDNSLSPTSSYVSDDYFGILDTDEGMSKGLLDIGMGRLPISTVEEAEQMVEKIIAYDNLANQGSWRNQLCFIGDDEDGNLHMRQADELAHQVSARYPAYNINKLFLDAYPQEKTATGFRYPDVVRNINNQVNRGALIVNYTGHGGPDALAHEKIVTKNEINSWSNQNMLPLFMTATCEFSRYDAYDIGLDVEETSAGEEVLLNTRGGGIGLFTTTRLVYSGPNHTLNEKFYEVVFEKDDNQQNYRLGDIIVYSKNNTGAGINKRNFTLLGDPSMRLAYPSHKVITDSINGIHVGVLEDTLSAFEWVTVSGHLESQDGVFMEDFNGDVYPMIFDKEKYVETLANDASPVFNFLARNSILYSGETSVTNGRFSFGFYVPKDINYAFGRGKISYYSKDSIMDAHGSFEGFEVGGIGTENVTDLEPPYIELYMNDSFFVSGGITDANPSLLVIAHDNFGINTTGNGIGHNLTATLDGNRSGAIILNEFFQANANSHNAGFIRYPYSNLEKGLHDISVKIWDIHNNSTEASIEFRVVDSEEMLIEQLFSYPNPFYESTLFNIEHNRPDQEMKLVITIYNLSGEMVRIIEQHVNSPGYRLAPPSWDGSAAGGSKLGGGVYVYKVTLSTAEGEVASKSGKMIMVR